MKTDYQIALEASQVILDRRGIKGRFELLPFTGYNKKKNKVVCKFQTFTLVYNTSKDGFLVDLHGTQKLHREANEAIERALSEH